MATGKKTGGRKAGTPNKATADIKALARKSAGVAIKELERLATKAKTEGTRVAAIKELLDRGYGRAPQAMEHTGKNGPHRVVVEIVDPTRGL